MAEQAPTGPTIAPKPLLSVSFHNFWRGFDPKPSFFAKALSQSYDITIEKAGRDLQISSVFGTESLPEVSTGRPLRIWWSGEARDPLGQIFDLYFAFRPETALLGSRWHRYPLWVSAIDWWNPTSPKHVERLLGPRPTHRRSQFCNFIYSTEPSIRSEFFLRLNEARPTGSFGRTLNNAGRRAVGSAGKMAVLADSTFTIAFENQLALGYVTEKLVHPLLAGSIPIYWGAIEAKTDFNPDAFIYAEDFSSMDDLVQHVIRVADSPEAVAEIASATPFTGNRIPYEHTPDFFVDRIGEALSGPPGPKVADRWPGPWTRRFNNPLKKLERKVRTVRDNVRAKIRSGPET